MKRANKAILKVVVDTNLFVSATVVAEGNPAKIVDA